MVSSAERLGKIGPFNGGTSMHRKWMRLGILAVLLISTVSLSMAACPRAMPDLYQANCGEVYERSAPGILANDIKDPGKTLSDITPDL